MAVIRIGDLVFDNIATMTREEVERVVKAFRVRRLQMRKEWLEATHVAACPIIRQRIVKELTDLQIARIDFYHEVTQNAHFRVIDTGTAFKVEEVS
jgi:hypothetical protein